MKVFPVGKRILVEPYKIDKEENKVKILLAKEEVQSLFKVKEIGDEVTKAQIGDIIFITPYSITLIKVNEKDFLLVMQDSIIAIIEDIE